MSDRLRVINYRASSYSSRGPGFSIDNRRVKPFDPQEITESDPVFRGHVDQGLNRSCIKYNIDDARLIESYISSVLTEDMRMVTVPDSLIRLYGNELKRFMCALQAYIDSPNPVIPIGTLLTGISDINFASKLKKIRNKSFEKSFGLQIYEVPDDYDDIPFYKIKDIGDIFNYNYWFFWEEESTDDLSYGFTPIKRIDPDHMESFKNMLFNILPEEFSEEIEEDEVLLSVSGSVAHNPGKGKYVYDVKQKVNSFSKSPLSGRRSHIKVSPANIRDSIILPVQQSNSVKLIEMQTRLIAEKLICSAYVRNTEEFNEILDNFSNKFTYFLDRDLKKEGITKPRELVIATLEVLKERYPKFAAWKYINIYSNLFIEDDDKILNPCRGHGLGMANAITTIIQIVIFLLCKRKLLSEYDINDNDISCVVYNDDFTAGATEEYLIDAYWDEEDNLMDAYQLIRNPEKSHKGKNSFSFCERYYPLTLNDKKSYKINEVYQPFAQKNIILAKMVMNNLSRLIEQSDQERLIRDLVTFWGYEYFPDEYKSPYLFGGWVTPVLNEVDLSFNYINEIGFNEYKAYQANKLDIFIKISKGRSGKYISPLEQITYRDDLEIPDYFNMFVNYGVDIQKVDDLFLIRNNDEYLNKKFSSLYKKRQKEFSKEYSSLPELRELFLECRNRFPLRDFLPNRRFSCKRKVMKEIVEDKPDCYPSVPNSILSMVKFFNMGKIRDNIVPFYRNLEGYKYGRFKLSDEEFRSNSLFRSNFDTEIDCTQICEDFVVAEDTCISYFDSSSIINVNFFVNHEIYYPDVDISDTERRDYDNPLNKKVEYFLSRKKFKNILLEITHEKGIYEGIRACEFLTDDLLYEEFMAIMREPRMRKLELLRQEKEKEETFYYIYDFVKWMNDGSPLTENMEDQELFIYIKMVRDQIELYADMYGSAEDIEIPEHVIEKITKHTGLINSIGGEIHQPRPRYIFVSFKELDPESDDDESEEFLVFD